MKKKKLLIVVVAVVVLIAAVILAPYLYAATLPRKVYTENDRTAYLTYSSLVSREEPSIKRLAERAGFACEATVLTNGGKKGKNGSHCEYVQFKMLVNDVWFGMPYDQILDIVIGGDPGEDIRPKAGDRIVIFADRGTKEAREKYDFEYAAEDHAYGIYIVNPDGRLFSLSYEEEFTAFDGKLPIVLKEHVRVLRLKDRIRALRKEEK